MSSWGRNSADKAKIKDLEDKNEDWSLQELVPNAHLTNSAWHEAQIEMPRYNPFHTSQYCYVRQDDLGSLYPERILR